MILRNGILVDEEIDISDIFEPHESESEVTKLIKGLSNATTVTEIRNIAKDILENTKEINN